MAKPKDLEILYIMVEGDTERKLKKSDIGESAVNELKFGLLSSN